MRIVSIILCVILLVFTLCACGKDESVPQMASEAISEVKSDADAIVSDENGYIGDEETRQDDSTQETTTDSTTSEETITSDSTDAFM